MRFLRFFSLTLLFSLLGATGFASVNLPTNLDREDREEALRIIGLGTSSKLLSDPYPMGGYNGFEFGLSVESLPTDELARLGNANAGSQQEASFTKLTIGKGLYNDIDIFLHFTPYMRSDDLSQFGGIVRWGFYQAEVLPFSASMLAHFNSGQIGDKLTTRSYGVDFLGGINVDNVALFAGGGPVEATGTFAAGGLTSTNVLETNWVSGIHSVVGANVQIFDNLFISGQIDRYTVAVFSGKLGVRF